MPNPPVSPTPIGFRQASAPHLAKNLDIAVNNIVVQTLLANGKTPAAATQLAQTHAAAAIKFARDHIAASTAKGVFGETAYDNALHAVGLWAAKLS